MHNEARNYWQLQSSNHVMNHYRCKHLVCSCRVSSQVCLSCLPGLSGSCTSTTPLRITVRLPTFAAQLRKVRHRRKAEAPCDTEDNREKRHLLVLENLEIRDEVTHSQTVPSSFRWVGGTNAFLSCSQTGEQTKAHWSTNNQHNTFSKERNNPSCFWKQ